jgi:hypothetical protein
VFGLDRVLRDNEGLVSFEFGGCVVGWCCVGWCGFVG